MMWWFDGWSWLVWPLMTLGMLAFWVVVAWIVITILRRGQVMADRRRPEEVLAERFAWGEIDEAEYERRLATLRHVGRSRWSASPTARRITQTNSTTDH